MMGQIELGLIAGLLLSVMFEYVPGLESHYAELDETRKRLVMLVMLVVVTVGIGGLSCINSPYTYIECSQAGIWDLASLFVAAVISNQSAHRMFKRPKAVTNGN